MQDTREKQNPWVGGGEWEGVGIGVDMPIGLGAVSSKIGMNLALFIPKIFIQNHFHPVMADFGQTDFGQTDFGQFFDRFWPIVVLTDFGQTDFGQL